MSKIRFTSLILLAVSAGAQEAKFGFADPVTVSFFGGHSRRAKAVSPESGTFVRGIRAVFYPTLKLGKNWFGYAAVQMNTEGYFYQELTESYNLPIKVHAVQAYMGYSRIREGRALTIKAGQLASAFGSFPLRYDDAQNWLIDMPQSYGYYYLPVTVSGLPGVEVDVTLGRLDLRAQLTNSSPSNPRSFRQSDQYANWTIGGGYEFRQGLRVGVSGMHGPYLHRRHRSFFPGEDAPKRLPATAYGADIQWARGRWNAIGEVQRFQYPYRAIPYFFQTLAYGEGKFTLHPRWYLAGRAGQRWRSGRPNEQAFEFVLGYRPAKGHLIKFGYLVLRGPAIPGTRDNIFGLQYVMNFNPPALGWGD